MLNNPTTEQELVELETAERSAMIEKYEALKVLLNDQTEAGKAFKTLVTEGYLREEPIRITSMLATDHVRVNNARGVLFEQLTAISHFEDYLSTIQALGAPINEYGEDDVEVEG